MIFTVLVDDKKEHNVANCEFAKSGDLKRKIVTDNVKVISEAKCILDYIVKSSRFDHKEAKKLTVVNLQACGKLNLLCRDSKIQIYTIT